ncbi:hypothetical protein PSI19_21120 [Xenorhabdus khoisanae]|uniref:hypothetical protein n=1 Tax=Xenorhabdus khoisanae TaxID=880157 RepID=UPI002359DAE2|nr:hypothetical protein [Xenorhabdus khoisanae]MDC9616299.1 hypothetical protein [Xenorhabdus khoisanae]
MHNINHHDTLFTTLIDEMAKHSLKHLEYHEPLPFVASTPELHLYYMHVMEDEIITDEYSSEELKIVNDIHKNARESVKHEHDFSKEKLEPICKKHDIDKDNRSYVAELEVLRVQREAAFKKVNNAEFEKLKTLGTGKPPKIQKLILKTVKSVTEKLIPLLRKVMIGIVDSLLKTPLGQLIKFLYDFLSNILKESNKDFPVTN